MYDADIILCCGGRSTIKEFVNRYYLTDLQLFSKDDAWIYYSSSTRKEVIGSIEVKSPTMVNPSSGFLYMSHLAIIRS